MASRDPALTVRPRSRRSIAHIPKTNPGLDKENVTTDIGAIRGAMSTGKPIPKDKKSRSKSLGPGGLDALQHSNGNRRKSTVALPLKSILKPTVPVSPIRQIPAFEETRRRNASRSPSPKKPRDAGKEANSQAEEGLLIDFSTPARAPVTGTEQLDNPFDGFNASSAIRDAKEREEKERKERERRAILEQREARRKSMANRRVSFAPEATLHTWNVVELGEDSTSSSTSNSTRRASSMTSTTNQPPSQAPEALATPEAEQDPDAAFSPIQPGLHGQEISGDLSSSPFSGSSVGGSEGTQSPVKEGIDEEAESDTDNDFDGEGTAMSLDEVTARTTATTQSDSSSTSSSSRLNEALRQAAHEAGTRGIDFDENGDMSMEMADQEITGAFKPWITKGQRISFDTEDMSALQDEENINHFQGQAQSENHDENDDDDDGNDYYNENEELSMEITNAVGRIFGSNPNRLSIGRRKSTAEETTYGDRTMEFTNVVGGIADHQSPAKSDIGSVVSENEEMTMEFTSVVGGVLGKGISGSERSDGNVLPDSVQESNLVGRDFSEWSTDGDGADEMDMEFTGAIGGILSPIEEQTESQDEFTGGMDVTAVMGTILPPGLETNNKQQAKQLMELESDAGQLVSSPFQERVNLSPPKLSASHHIAPVASESGSPSLASVRSRQTGRSSSTGTGTPLRQTTPRKPMTPSKQLTPQPLRPSNPGKTPPSSNVTFRSASPKKLFKHEIRAAAKQSHSPHLFENDEQTGESTPAIILRPPHSRRSSGLGIDKEGLGSPKVAALLDRRRSIGEDAQEFVPQDEPSRRLRFDDPVKIHEEVDREREEEENREDGHIPPVNDLDATSNLKELISSLTPKKRKVGTRKSLHVGAAKGVLGKRPVELDEEEEEESPKRLRGRNASPVKSIKLPAPPSKDETVGRAARPSTNKLFDLSPQKTGSFTPRKPNPTIAVTSPSKNAQTSEDVPETAEQEAEDGEDVDLEPIQLQDFLNMTNIHFMELTTTKRRHTTAPGNDSNALERTGTRDANREISLEDCVAAGFCTVPMLELYQHSCRELKSYISEGRQIIRSIETETYADNPPLFREYMTARPDIRLLMDNQFRNVKTHARLLSKAMWYEWRMKLLEGLKEGLDRHLEEMKADDSALSKQERILDSVVPALVEKHSSAESEATKLQEIVDEMENCDQDELRTARERLAAVDAEIAAKKKQLEEMQEAYTDRVDTIEAGTELKAEFMEQIREADRVREECRGWSVREVNTLRDSVYKLESQSGWSIVSADNPKPDSPAGPVLNMRYKDELQATFYPKVFKSAEGMGEADGAPPFELAYSPQTTGSPTTRAPSLTPSKSLILSQLRAHISTIQPSSTSPKSILRFISDGWNLARHLEEEIRVLDFNGVTRTNLMEKVDGGPQLRVRCILVGAMKAGEQRNARVDVDFHVTARVVRHQQDDNTEGPEKLDVNIDVTLSKVYGFNDTGPKNKGLTESQMRDIVLQNLGIATKGQKKVAPPTSNLGDGVWGHSVRKLVGNVFSS